MCEQMELLTIPHSCTEECYPDRFLPSLMKGNISVPFTVFLFNEGLKQCTLHCLFPLMKG